MKYEVSPVKLLTGFHFFIRGLAPLLLTSLTLHPFCQPLLPSLRDSKVKGRACSWR